MSINYSGRILWANGTPIPDVQVRLFKPHDKQNLGAELTIQSGLSAVDGTFTIQAQDTSFLDNELLIELGFLSPQFDGIIISGLSLGSEPRPILQFTYFVKGHNVQTLIPFLKLHRTYRLAHYPPVDFLPSRNGFSFANSFKPFIPTISLPKWLGGKFVPDNYGLCGGMSSAAYDYCLAGVSNPHAPNIRQYNKVPNNGTILHRFVLRRTLDTFGKASINITKVGDWTMLPDQGPAGTQKLTLDEWPTIHQKLEEGQCVVLALIYERASDFLTMVKKIWWNHQVLAYGITQIDSDTYEISIYDSNHPDKDNITIRTHRAQVDSSQGHPILGMVSRQVIPGSQDVEVRGYFPMDYTYVNPPGY